MTVQDLIDNICLDEADWKIAEIHINGRKADEVGVKTLPNGRIIIDFYGPEVAFQLRGERVMMKLRPYKTKRMK